MILDSNSLTKQVQINCKSHKNMFSTWRNAQNQNSSKFRPNIFFESRSKKKISKIFKIEKNIKKISKQNIKIFQNRKISKNFKIWKSHFFSKSRNFFKNLEISIFFKKIFFLWRHVKNLKYKYTVIKTTSDWQIP